MDSPHNQQTDERQETDGTQVGTDDQQREETTNQNNESGDGWSLFGRDILVSIVAVLLLGGFLFAISGVWPPMVAIESGSMETNMNVNDLVFVMDPDRFQPAEAADVGPGDTGIVPANVGDDTGYTMFGESGDVIVFAPDGNEERTPIIHRAMFWVEEGENWCEDDAVNSEYLGNADPDSEECEVPHDGFITKGDNNPTYDQIGNQISEPVKPAWVIGTAEIRIPGLGWLRLRT